jgi:hypothetical protein
MKRITGSARLDVQRRKACDGYGSGDRSAPRVLGPRGLESLLYRNGRDGVRWTPPSASQEYEVRRGA